MEFRGCSKLKYLWERCDLIQSFAANSAISVSRFTFLLLAAGSFSKASGIPFGNRSFLNGFGENLTPGIGFSRAREKVEQFGAQCLMRVASNSRFKTALWVKTSRPLSKSHGSRTALLFPQSLEESLRDLSPPERWAAARPKRSCPYLSASFCPPLRFPFPFASLCFCLFSFFLRFCSALHSGVSSQRGS